MEFDNLPFKKIGIFTVLLGTAFLIVLTLFTSVVNSTNRELCQVVCGEHEETCPMDSSAVERVSYYVLSTTMLGIIATGTVLSLGKPEKLFSKQKSEFEIILSVLEDEEKQVLKAINKQEGIKQSTLKYRVDMSKTKLSYVLRSLEDKELIEKEQSGRTYKIYFKREF